MCALLDNPYEVKEFLRHIYINDRTLFIKGEHDINIEDYIEKDDMLVCVSTGEIIGYLKDIYK